MHQTEQVLWKLIHTMHQTEQVLTFHFHLDIDLGDQLVDVFCSLNNTATIFKVFLKNLSIVQIILVFQNCFATKT